MRRMLLLGLMTLGAVAHGAELASPLDQPYRLLVCLRFSEDPIFTRFFVGSVERQVRDQLANYFGSLAEVQVAAGHVLFEKLAPSGLAGMTLTPAQFADLKGRDKVFLIAVDFDEGTYRIQSRQLDGEVEDAGLLHSRSSPDRQWLVKAICLAVKEDFAPVAVVEPIEGGNEVRLSFRGAERSDRLSAWLKDGCVLQPFRMIRQANGTLRHEQIVNVVLQVAAGSDGKRATVASSRGSPWQRTARVAGFQAIRLTTQTGRIRLRLINAETGDPALGCMVYANSDGFGNPTDHDRLPMPDREGWVVATRPFDQVAFITIKQREETAVQILLPITADWVEQVYRITVDKRSREKDEWQRRIRYCAQDIQILQASLEQFVREVNTLNKGKRYEEALKQAQAAVTALQPMIAATRAGMFDAEQDAKQLQVTNNSLLVWASQQLQDIELRHRQLQELVADLERTILDMNSRNRAKVLVNLAGQAENAGDIDEAMKQYEAALKEVPDQPQVQKRLDELKEAWRIKSPEHQSARAFVFQTLAKAQVNDLASLLSRAESAFTTLRQLDDYLSLRKMMTTIGDHSRELADIVDTLAGRDTEEDRREYETFNKLAERAVQFQRQILDYLKARAEKHPAASVPTEGPAEKSPAPKDQKPPSPEEEATPANNEKTPPLEGVHEKEETPLKPNETP